MYVQANQLTDLFRPSAVAGNVGPTFNWNILNYGRIRNHVRAEEARFLQDVTRYQNTVLNAAREVEDAIVAYLRAQDQADVLRKGVAAAVLARDLTAELYKAGKIDFGRVFFAEYFLVQQQDELAHAEGAVALALVEIYRALGGGWEVSPDCLPPMTIQVRVAPGAEELPPPAAEAPPAARPQAPQPTRVTPADEQ